MTRQQTIGILFLLLISGSECARMATKIEANDKINHLSESLTALHDRLGEKAEKATASRKADFERLKWIDWTSNFGNSVCPEDMGLADITKRFEYKSQKLQTTADQLESSGLMLGAARGKIREFLMRAKAMYDCSSAEKTRPELDALVNDPATGVKAQLTEVYQKLVKTVNESSVTHWRPDELMGCSMDLKLDFTDGPTVVAFQKSFYGASCDVAAYQAKQPAVSGNILKRIDEKLKQILEDGQVSDSALEELIEKTVEEVENGQPDGLASLLELDAAPHPARGAAAVFAAAALLFLSPIILVLLVVVTLVAWNVFDYVRARFSTTPPPGTPPPPPPQVKDPFCPAGYEAKSADMDGTGKKSENEDWFRTIEQCGKVCDARKGCTGFEFSMGSQTMGSCVTYTGGNGNLKNDDNRLAEKSKWRSCMVS